MSIWALRLKWLSLYLQAAKQDWGEGEESILNARNSQYCAWVALSISLGLAGYIIVFNWPSEITLGRTIALFLSPIVLFCVWYGLMLLMVSARLMYAHAQGLIHPLWMPFMEESKVWTERHRLSKHLNDSKKTIKNTPKKNQQRL